MDFRWNDRNVTHVLEYNVSPEEAEYIVENAAAPFPEARADEKWLVWGQTPSGDFLQVIYVWSPEDVVYVIHATPLTDSEKRRFRRRKT